MINEVDYENIRRELDARKTRHLNGGTLTEEFIKMMTSEQLQKLVDEYSANEREKVNKIHKRSFSHYTKKMFDAVPELKWIPFWILVFDETLDVMEGVTPWNDMEFEEAVEKKYNEKYGKGAFDKWCSIMFECSPYEDSWENDYTCEIKNEGDVHIKCVTRDGKIEDKNSWEGFI